MSLNCHQETTPHLPTGYQFPFRYKTQGQARPSAVPTFYPLLPHTTPHSSFCPPPFCTYRSGQGLQGPPCCHMEGTPLRPYLHLVASPLADRTPLPVTVLPPLSYSFSALGSSPPTLEGEPLPAFHVFSFCPLSLRDLIQILTSTTTHKKTTPLSSCSGLSAEPDWHVHLLTWHLSSPPLLHLPLAQSTTGSVQN